MAKKDILAMQKRSHELGVRIAKEEKELQFSEARLKDFLKRQKVAKDKGDDKDAADFQRHIDFEKKKIKLLKAAIPKEKKEEKKLMDQIRKMTK